MNNKLPVDPAALREEVKNKYREVAAEPNRQYHFHTGRALTRHLGYDLKAVEKLPERAVESFAGVANPFVKRHLSRGERVVDAGSGAGFDCFLAATQVGSQGRVVGVDMLPEMVDKANGTATAMGMNHVEFREGLLEKMPVVDGWADVVISNGVFNLCVDKAGVFAEIWRVLRPGGRLQFGDIANSKPVPDAAIHDIDLWTAWIAGGVPCERWQQMMHEAGFTDIEVSEPYDTFGKAGGEKNARAFGVYGYTFMACKPK